MNLGKDHRVELEGYSGPLDLLLWLIRKEEVDIHDIPIARILDRYLEILPTIRALDLDQAGEFLVMASTLMQIKSRSLLPRDEPIEEDELDPRFELVQKLLEYRKFKEVSEELRDRADDWSHRFPPGRAPELPGTPPDEVPIADVSIWDLAVAFQKIVSEVGDDRGRSIVYDDVPIETHIREIETVLAKRRRAPFVELFPKRAPRPVVAGLFVALLELIKLQRVRAFQKEPFAPIEIEAREPDGPPDEPVGEPEDA